LNELKLDIGIAFCDMLTAFLENSGIVRALSENHWIPHFIILNK